MIIYLYLFLLIILLLYLQTLTTIKWKFDYFKQLEKQCVIIE
jgi:hypothetical protein